MKSYLTLCLFILCTYGYSQNQVAGKVIDDITKQGVMGVSVYLNNTTFGAKTDRNGEYFFYCPMAGKVDIVATHINYEKMIQSVNLSINNKIEFSLKQKETNLQQVVITAAKSQSEADRTKWFNLFSLNLIGNYGSAGKLSKISNPEVLHYAYNKNTKELIVRATQALAIENPYLGYKIYVDLERFDYNFLTDEVSYKYTALYEYKLHPHLTPEAVLLNRNRVYGGSVLHFMRSLYTNRLAEEGFTAYNYATIDNTEKRRVAETIRKAIADKYETEKNPKVLLTSLFSRDTANYYTTVMKQPNAKSVKVTEAVTRTLITKNKFDRTINFSFADTLRIDYKAASTDKIDKVRAILKSQDVIKFKTSEHSNGPLTTYLYFFEDGGVNIENTGFYPDFRLFMYGNMAERRLANALPYDFEPIVIPSK